MRSRSHRRTLIAVLAVLSIVGLALPAASYSHGMATGSCSGTAGAGHFIEYYAATTSNDMDCSFAEVLQLGPLGSHSDSSHPYHAHISQVSNPGNGNLRHALCRGSNCDVNWYSVPW